MEKALLILDIDETLIYATKTKLDIVHDFIVYNYFVYERPNLEEFIDQIKNDYQLAIWSSAGDDYVNEVIKQSVLKKFDFKFIWGRSKATFRRNVELDESRNYGHDTSHFHYVKSLKKVKKLGYNIERVLIVDDSPHKSKLNYGNAIYPNSFEGDQQDNELQILSIYLRSIKDCKNFRVLEKRNWRNKIK